ncbi:hypothetical protein D3C71_1163310 [compost metagenome]
MLGIGSRQCSVAGQGKVGCSDLLTYLAFLPRADGNCTSVVDLCSYTQLGRLFVDRCSNRVALGHDARRFDSSFVAATTGCELDAGEANGGAVRSDREVTNGSCGVCEDAATGGGFSCGLRRCGMRGRSKESAAERIGLGIRDLVDRNSLTCICPNLEQLAGERAVQQFRAVEVGLLGDTIDFTDQLIHFGLQCLAIALRVGCVGSLHRQFTDALQVVADFGQGAFCNLRQRDAVIGVADGDISAADLRAEALGDRQASCVVFCAVDART